MSDNDSERDGEEDDDVSENDLEILGEQSGTADSTDTMSLHCDTTIYTGMTFPYITVILLTQTYLMVVTSSSVSSGVLTDIPRDAKGSLQIQRLSPRRYT